ncbi:MAG: CpaF family protein [Anaerolineales bacterium]
MDEPRLTYIPSILKDPKALRLKAHLIGMVAPDLQKLPAKDQTRDTVRQALERAFAQLRIDLPAAQRDPILKDALADLVGYGPLEYLLDDPEISEIMVNGASLTFVEKMGVVYETDIRFEDDAHLMRIVDRILHPLGRRVDYDNPTSDARLPDGSRVNVIIPPVAVDGPHLSIRKFLTTRMQMENLIELGTLTPHMAKFLEACVVARLNIIVTGNTSSGKSTMLNILSSFIPNHERIITIEDAVELQLKQRHVVRLETKLPNTDGVGAVNIRDLVRNALRMRPDRLVVGEVRGGESLDMLQAMNTGHSGSLTTLHANSPRDAIARMETMALMSGIELPVVALRRQIAAAIDLIVHMSRLQDGTRKVTQITEVVGMESDIVTLMDIFKFTQTGVSSDGRVLGELRATGIRPQFNPKLEVAGYKLGGEIFGAGL